MAISIPGTPSLSSFSSCFLHDSTIKPTFMLYPRSNAKRRSFAFPRMVSNGYVAGRRATGSYGGRIHRRVSSCLVIPPPVGRKPRGIIKFLGGAFIGAVPEVTYGHLMNLLAKEGFLVVSVPYNVTFDHTQAAKEVYERFHACMEMLLTTGLSYAAIRPSDLADLPFYSVGHSNGALLQLLVGSYYSEKLPKANVIISFNNRPAADAVPYIEQFGPVVRQVVPVMESSPFYTLARDASGNAWKTLLDTAGTLVQNVDQEAIVSLNNFVDQLPSVMSQVSQGMSEFRPSPSENCDFFKKSYNVPHTLLVKFSDDAIDESDRIEKILRPRVDAIGGTLRKITLSGNHITPCIQDLRWEVGSQYTPADAIAQGLKSISLSDTRVLAGTITNWFKDLEQ